MAVPKLRFKEFKNEWKIINLKQILSFKNGINANKDSYGRGIKYISVGDILNNTFITYDKIKGLVDINEKMLNENSVEYGDIVFQRSSETFNDIGQSNVYLDKEEVATFGGFVIRGKKVGNYNPLFLNYLLKSPYNRRKIIIKGAGAQHYNISQEELEKININFTNEKEQEKIANLFSLLDQKIELQKRKSEALKIYKIGLIQKTYNNNCGNKIKMKDLIIQKSIRNTKNEVDNVYSVSNKEGFILQSEQFKDRTVASEDTQNYKIVEKNDFAYNPARINVGSITRMKQDVKGIISPMYICFRGNEKIIPEYLEYFFKSYKFTYEMNKRLEGSVRMCLSYESMINIPIALPCIEEQRKVSDLFNSVGHKINQEERKLKKLNEIKKGLLQKMFI
ncbi:restriction endonuclease subunit S [Thomasclavelia cocleata]|uniref:restriction endonuclease subunit S n=1 Tax=Thomasclavelia cocleata TaxID=69824 RepID=UPI00272E450A|nr:restriction endonuclease subunit S [Thomasclavelia cocleata]